MRGWLPKLWPRSPVTVDPPPPPPAPVASFTVDVVSGYAPLRVRFTATSTGVIDGHRWDPGDGSGVSKSTGPVFEYEYTNPQDLAATLVSYGPGGSSVPFVGPAISILEPPAAPILSSPSVTPDVGDAPLFITASVRVSGMSDAVEFQWGNGTSSRIQTNGAVGVVEASTTIQSPGDLCVTMKAIGPGGGSNLFKVPVTVTEPVAPGGVQGFPIYAGNASQADQENLIGLASFPKSRNLLDTSTLQVLDLQGQPVPCQFKVLSRFGKNKTRESTDAPIRTVQAVWKGLCPAATSNGQGVAGYFIQTDRDPAQRTGGDLMLQDYGTHFRVATSPSAQGPSYWEIDKTDSTVLREAVVDGRPIILGPGAIESVWKDGPVTPYDVQTVVEEIGDVRIQIKQTGKFFERNGSPIGYTIRYEFWSKSNDVVINAHINQRRPYSRGLGNSEYLNDFHLTLPIANSGVLKAVSREGQTDVAAVGGTYRLAGRMRELISSMDGADDDRPFIEPNWPAGAQINTSHHHILAWREGAPGAMTDHLEDMYEHGFQVAGDASLAVAIERFAERAPGQYRVADGKLSISFFPEEEAGFDRFTGYHWYGEYEKGLVGSGGVAERVPAGNHPVAGRPYRDFDHAPAGFPDSSAPAGGAKPAYDLNTLEAAVSGNAWRWNWAARIEDENGVSTNIATPAGQSFNAYKTAYEDANPLETVILRSAQWTFLGNPRTQADQDSIDYYRLEAGGDFGGRVVLSFRRSDAAMSPTDLKAVQEAANHPAVGFTDPKDYRINNAFGYDFYERQVRAADGNVEGDHDIDRYERFADILADDLAVDPQTSGGNLPISLTGNYFGFPQAQRRGAHKSGQGIRRIYGWDNYGNFTWDAQTFNNLHYDLPFVLLNNAARRLDTRFLTLARRHTTWQRDRGYHHGDGDFQGGAYWEKANWHGMGKYPFASHIWIRGQCLNYLFYGDEKSADAIRETAIYWTRRSSGWSPAAWIGQYSVRTPGWAIEGLTDIANMLGDIQGHQGRHVLEEAVLGAERLTEMESGIMGFGGVPIAQGGTNVNIVPAEFSTTGQPLDFTARGFILDMPGQQASNRWFTQPWHQMIANSAMCYLIRSHEEATETAPRWAPIYASLARARNHFRTESCVIDEAFVPNFANVWYPQGHTLTNTWSNNLATWSGADMFAQFHNIFEGTSYEDSEDFETALLYARYIITYPMGDYYEGDTPRPSYMNFGDPSDPARYDQATGLPNAAVQAHNVNLNWSGGGGQQTKFIGQQHQRRVAAVWRILLFRREAEAAA